MRPSTGCHGGAFFVAGRRAGAERVPVDRARVLAGVRVGRCLGVSHVLTIGEPHGRWVGGSSARLPVNACIGLHFPPVW